MHSDARQGSCAVVCSTVSSEQHRPLTAPSYAANSETGTDFGDREMRDRDEARSPSDNTKEA